VYVYYAEVAHKALTLLQRNEFSGRLTVCAYAADSVDGNAVMAAERGHLQSCER